VIDVIDVDRAVGHHVEQVSRTGWVGRGAHGNSASGRRVALNLERVAGGGVFVAQPDAYHSGALLGGRAISQAEAPVPGFWSPGQPRARTHDGGIHADELHTQENRRAIGGGQPGIDVAPEIAAVVALRTQEDIRPARSLDDPYPVIRGTVSGCIATEYIR